MSRIDDFSGEYRFLSNFYEYRGFCVENYYQAAKTDDVGWKARILLAPTARDAKQWGRQAPMRPTWDDEKIAVMRSLLIVKFRATELAERLLDTGNARLIEGNTWGDQFWGVCDGKGKNWLGKLLMETRAVLRMAEDMTGV